jgi:HAD superfamily hydrolase (TIGR01549 family)
MTEAIRPDQFDAILFDLDGTLVDTDDMAVARMERRLRPFLGERAKTSARWLVMKAETPGNQFITALDMLHLDRTLLGLIDKADQWRGVCPVSKFHLIGNVEPLVLALANRYKIGLVTTRTRYHIDQFLDRFPEMGGAFQTTIGCHESRRLKPHPEPVLLAAKELGVDVSRCLMVGDTAVDIRAGRAAGAWTAGVLCGFGREWELAKAGAHLILPSTADLHTILL